MLFSKPALLFLCVFLKHRGTVEEVVGRTKQVGWEHWLPELLVRLLMLLPRLRTASLSPAGWPSPISQWKSKWPLVPKPHTGPGREEVWSSGRN